MTDTSSVTTAAATDPTPPNSAWMTICKYAMGAFVVCSLFYLVIAGKVPATDYELLVVVPILGALGIHQARQAGSDIAAKATIAAQTPPAVPPQNPIQPTS